MSDAAKSGPGDPHVAEIDEGEVLEWTCHPVKKKPLVSVVVSALIVAMVVFVYWATYSNWFTVLAAVILIASLGKFYLPTKYRLTDRGVVVKSTTQTLTKDWGLYRSCYPDKKGVLLSPFVGPSRLENFRGLYIMTTDNRDEVVAFVKERIKRAHTHEAAPPKENA